MTNKLRYRLGLDLGAKSLGWAMVRLNQDNKPIALIKVGSRIFSDGRTSKTQQSLAVTRRLARQSRKRRDRFIRRRCRLIQDLIEWRFFPKDEEERKKLVHLNPYELRKRGLDEPLKPEEFARAVFHLNQRRGFKSNRKTDKPDESGLIRSTLVKMRERLVYDQARTIGEWLAQQHENRKPVRARLHGKNKSDKYYDLYLDRQMIFDEFEALWNKQAEYQPQQYCKEAHDRLSDTLFHQRALKPVEPGRCTLDPEELRAANALPSSQLVRILQEVNNLCWIDQQLKSHPLKKEQAEQIVKVLMTKDCTFNQMKKMLGLNHGHFNLENEKRDKLKGDACAKIMASTLLFGERWYTFDRDTQNEIVEKCLYEESELELIKVLVDKTGIDTQNAEAIANKSLPSGYARLSLKAMEKIIPHLSSFDNTYANAVKAAGYDSHSALDHTQQTGELLLTLPYYGQYLQRHVAFGNDDPNESSEEKRYGKIANPTVHIGLNQIRVVVNALIRRYGPPTQVVIEVARELKQSKNERDRIQKEQAANQKKRDDWGNQIWPILGQKPTRDDFTKMRLWEELNSKDAADRRCPYTGENISLTRLFSAEVEIEHILPFSRTLDDSMSNKTLCMRYANREKAEKTPFEAFGHNPPGYSYEQIRERIQALPANKRKRFAENIWEQWLGEDRDFIARALNDTRYLSRIALRYLSLICPHQEVWAIPGQPPCCVVNGVLTVLFQIIRPRIVKTIATMQLMRLWWHLPIEAY